MGRNNQQRRAAKAKERKRRVHAGAGPGSAFGVPPAAPWGSFTEPARPPSDEDRIAGDLDEAFNSLAMGHVEGAEPAIRRLVGRSFDPARQASICRLLGSRLRTHSEHMWTDGWRPIDLHEIIGRKLDAHAQTVAGDLMAGRLSAYAVSTLAADWPGQLRSIGASVWWPADQNHLAARAVTDGFEATLRSGLAVAALIATLPRIERIDPPPGEARPERTARSAPDVDPRMLERVRRLLAQAESTPYEAEAETFTAAAQSLMARHSLDAAMLAASTDRRTDRPAPVRIWIERPYEQEKVQLLQSVADANRCRTVWSSGLGFATIVGHRADLASVETIFTSLLLQATRAMAGEGRRVTSSGVSRTRRFRKSFLTAYAVHIGDRLRAATESETASAIKDYDEAAGAPGAKDDSRALVRVLADRSAEVDATFDDMFPDLVMKRSRTTHDAQGWAAGHHAAESATLFGAESTLAGSDSAHGRDAR